MPQMQYRARLLWRQRGTDGDGSGVYRAGTAAGIQPWGARQTAPGAAGPLAGHRKPRQRQPRKQDPEHDQKKDQDQHQEQRREMPCPRAPRVVASNQKYRLGPHHPCPFAPCFPSRSKRINEIGYCTTHSVPFPEPVPPCSGPLNCPTFAPQPQQRAFPRHAATAPSTSADVVEKMECGRARLRRSLLE